VLLDGDSGGDSGGDTASPCSRLRETRAVTRLPKGRPLCQAAPRGSTCELQERLGRHLDARHSGEATAACFGVCRAVIWCLQASRCALRLPANAVAVVPLPPLFVAWRCLAGRGYECR
jgi:hypothetical protein